MDSDLRDKKPALEVPWSKSIQQQANRWRHKRAGELGLVRRFVQQGNRSIPVDGQTHPPRRNELAYPVSSCEAESFANSQAAVAERVPSNCGLLGRLLSRRVTLVWSAIIASANRFRPRR
jgi:hypothetical protein